VLDQWFPTQGCREEVSGVPPNIEFTTFFSFFTTKVAPNCHFSQGKGAAKFFFSLTGCREPKKVEKHCPKRSH